MQLLCIWPRFRELPILPEKNPTLSAISFIFSCLRSVVSLMVSALRRYWLGHKDLASTMVYLKAVRNKDVMDRVNSSALAGFVA